MADRCLAELEALRPHPLELILYSRARGFSKPKCLWYFVDSRRSLLLDLMGKMPKPYAPHIVDKFADDVSRILKGLACIQLLAKQIQHHLFDTRGMDPANHTPYG
jgi:hypothetical protein